MRLVFNEINTNFNLETYIIKHIVLDKHRNAFI